MEDLKKALGKWWILLILGVVAIALGVWVLGSPAKSFSAMATILMILFLAMGIGDILYIIINRKGIPAWGWNLVGAVLIFLLGIAVAVKPFGSELLLAFMFAFGVFVFGCRGISNSFVLKEAGFNGWWAALILGIINTLIGCSLLFHPLYSVVIYAVLLGVSIIISGVNLITTSIMMSKAKGFIEKNAQ